MEPDKRTMAPSEDAGLGGLVLNDSLSDIAVRQGLSDNEPSYLSPTVTQSSAPPPSQLEPNTMSGESSDDPGHLRSSTISEPPQGTLPPEPSQPEGTKSTLGGGHASSSTLISVNPNVPLAPTTEGTSRRAGSKPESEGSPATSSKLYASETCPFSIPLPESDDEEQGPSLARAKPSRSTLYSKNQDRGAYATDSDERANTLGDPDPPNIIRPSKPLFDTKIPC